jgi:TetR/AcrR family transcriptional regulator, transcriptional repressor for nem operon
MNDSKEHIIAVASRLFLQKNFKEVTMKEIVNKTGLSKGAFYHYFESKEKLFGEVIDQFLSSQMYFDFDKYSNSSLYEFYHVCANNSNSIKEIISGSNENADDAVFSTNFYFLIFDAMNLIPGFRKKIEDYGKKELNAWSLVIKKAKESGEIKSTLSDKQIAMIFTSTADGVAMKLIFWGKYENLKKELVSLWDSFYESLKA